MTKEEKSAIPHNSDIGVSLIETIGSPDLESLAQDFGEVALDSILRDGILKDIPVISSIVGVAKAAISIRDKLLVRKLLHFLRELSDTNEEERRNFLAQFEEDPKEQRKVGENLILLLDRLDNLDKPAMVAKLLKAYIKREIESYDEFTYFSTIVDRAPMLDLSSLLSYFSGGDVDAGWLAQKFYHLGLSDISIFVVPSASQAGSFFNGTNQISGVGGADFSLSDNAQSFAKIILGDAYRPPR